MQTDHDINDLFHRATHDLTVDVPAIVDAGARHGRRLERRRTLTRVVAPLVAAAVVLPLTAAALLLGGSGGDLPVAGETASTAPRVAAFDDEEMAEQLRSALAELAPDLTVTRLEPGSHEDRRTPDATLTLDVPEGEATVGVQVWPLLDDETPENVLAGTCANPYREPGEPEAVCTPVPGGTLAATRHGVTQADLDAMPEDQREGSPGSSLSVVLITDDGLRVSAAAGLSLPGSTSSNLPAPPLGEHVLAQLVQDPRWLTTAIPSEAPVQRPVRRSELTQPEAAALLEELVTEAVRGVGITAVDFAPAPGFVRAALLADDGNGVSRIELSLGQPTDDFNFARMLSESPPCGEGCVETEDGALTTLSEYSPAKDRLTGVENTAGYLRADGLAVHLSSFNTEVHWVEATRTTRPTPLLSAEQLAKIATSPRWLG